MRDDKDDAQNAEQTKAPRKLGLGYGLGLLLTLVVVIAAILAFAYGAAPRA